MTTEDRAGDFAQAVLDQLSAEIAAKGYTVKSLAAEMGRDYNTYRRWIIGERPMPVNALWATLDTLSVDGAVFMRRSQDRFESR